MANVLILCQEPDISTRRERLLNGGAGMTRTTARWLQRISLEEVRRQRERSGQKVSPEQSRKGSGKCGVSAPFLPQLVLVDEDSRCTIQ
jgi:hypothetical protein